MSNTAPVAGVNRRTVPVVAFGLLCGWLTGCGAHSAPEDPTLVAWDQAADRPLPAPPAASPQDLPRKRFERLIDDQVFASELHRGHWLAIDVDQGSLSDAGLRTLQQLPQLRELRARYCRFTDAGLPHLSRLRALEVLNLPHTAVTDTGLDAICDLPELSLLRIGSPHLSDACLKSIRRLPKLRFLHLIDVPITDAGLQSLHDWHQLESLYLDGADVTGEGVLALLRACPDLHLHIDQQHHDRDPAWHRH